MSNINGQHTIFEYYISFFNLYADAVSLPTLTSFEQLTDGIHSYSILALAAQYAFHDKASLTLNCDDNWILKRTNLDILFFSMNSFAVNYLFADAFDLGSLISTEDIAKGANDYKDTLATLCGYVVTMVLMAGNSAVSDSVKRVLPRECQVELSTIVKKLVTLHGFKRLTGASKTIMRTVSLSATREVSSSPLEIPSIMLDSSYNYSSDPSADYRNYKEVEKLRSELSLVTNDLREKTQALQVATDRSQLIEQQLHGLQTRYQTLLDISESKGPSTREKELLSILTESNMEIQLLKSDLADVMHANKESKVKLETTEDALEVLRRERDQLHRQLKRRNEEKLETENRLQLAEDRLAKNIKRREEMEDATMALRQSAESAVSGKQSLDHSLTSSQTLHDALGGGAQFEYVHQLEDEVRDLKRKMQSQDTELVLLKRSIPEREGFNTGEPINGEGVYLGAVAMCEEIERLNSMLDGANTIISKLEIELKDANSRIDVEHQISISLQASLACEKEETLSKNNEMNNDSQQLSSQLKELIRDHDQLKKEKNNLQSEMAKLQTSKSIENVPRKNEIDKLRDTWERGRKLMREEQRVLTSMIFHCGQQNLILRQCAAFTMKVRGDSYHAGLLFNDLYNGTNGMTNPTGHAQAATLDTILGPSQTLKSTRIFKEACKDKRNARQSSDRGGTESPPSLSLTHRKSLHGESFLSVKRLNNFIDTLFRKK